MSEAIIPKEEWKPVVGFEGLYEVSSAGRVRSMPRKHRSSLGLREYGGQIIKPLKKNNGYLVVNLTDVDRRLQEMIHRLVLLSFVGSPEKGYECCHSDGDQSNNHLSNLRWDTRKNNHADKRFHGTQTRGESHHTSKVTEADVLFIRTNTSMTDVALSRMLNIGTSQIGRIARRESWKHI